MIGGMAILLAALAADPVQVERLVAEFAVTSEVDAHAAERLAACVGAYRTEWEAERESSHGRRLAVVSDRAHRYDLFLARLDAERRMIDQLEECGSAVLDAATERGWATAIRRLRRTGSLERVNAELQVARLIDVESVWSKGRTNGDWFPSEGTIDAVERASSLMDSQLEIVTRAERSRLRLLAEGASREDVAAAGDQVRRAYDVLRRTNLAACESIAMTMDPEGAERFRQASWESRHPALAVPGPFRLALSELAEADEPDCCEAEVARVVEEHAAREFDWRRRMDEHLATRSVWTREDSARFHEQLLAAPSTTERDRLVEQLGGTVLLKERIAIDRESLVALTAVLAGQETLPPTVVALLAWAGST